MLVIIFLNLIIGSHEGHTAYFYKRLNVEGTYDDSHVPTLTIPGRKGFLDEATGGAEKDIQVYCDPAFLNGVKGAVGKVSKLKTATDDLLNSHLSAGRPKRAASSSRVQR